MTTNTISGTKTPTQDKPAIPLKTYNFSQSLGAMVSKGVSVMGKSFAGPSEFGEQKVIATDQSIKNLTSGMKMVNKMLLDDLVTLSLKSVDPAIVTVDSNYGNI